MGGHEKRLKQIEEEVDVLCELQAKVEKEMGTGLGTKLDLFVYTSLIQYTWNGLK